MSAPQSDHDLLIRWSAGCSAAGSTLIDRYFTLVQRFFSSKVPGDTADLVQQTFLACIEARDSFRGQASFKTFLLAIARHQLFAFYRQRDRRALDVSMTSLRDLATSPSGRLAQQQYEQLLTEALTRLPLESQVILELVYWQGLSGGELASVLEVPVNTASSKLRRARLALLEQLVERTGDRNLCTNLLERLPPLDRPQS